MSTVTSDLVGLPRGQRLLIATMRAQLKPLPVDAGHVPNWLRRALLKAYGSRWYGNASGPAILYEVIGLARWLDHYGSTKLDDGRIAFVSEPYEFTTEDEAQVASIAERIGCEWWQDGNSWWFPGRTKRIVFAPRSSPKCANGGHPDGHPTGIPAGRGC